MLREVLSCNGKPTALFVDASDQAKFSAAVTALLTDPVLSDELRQNAKGLKLRYSLNAMVEEYVQILDQVDVIGMHRTDGDMIVEFRCEREHARLWMYRELLAIEGRDVPVQIAWTTTVRAPACGIGRLVRA